MDNARNKVGLAAVAAVIVLGGAPACEDGPAQPFSPASGTLFNNGDSVVLTDPVTAPLDGGYAGQSRQEICSGDELQLQWSKMIKQPIVPPSFYAGIDLADGVKFNGLRIDKAENGPSAPAPTVKDPNDTPTRLCQSKNVGAGGNADLCSGSSSLVSAWGNNNEVTMEWCVATKKAILLNLNPGYTGTMEWDYTPVNDSQTGKPDGKKHHYVFQIGKTIQRDGQQFLISWDGFPNVGAKTKAQVDELYRGIVSTFSPDIYFDTPNDCFTQGTCLINTAGNTGDVGQTVIGFRPAGFYFETFSPALPQPSGSSMAKAYIFNIKYAPYSVSRSHLTLADAVGPVSDVDPGDAGKHCHIQLGMTFGDLTDNCIKVFNSSATNDRAFNKVLGNLAHDDQNFAFSVVGVNTNFRPKALDLGQPRQFDVINDTDTVAPTDTADDFQIDVRTYGPILNDQYKITSATTGAVTYKKDYHGSGEVWKEYQRLVQTDLAKAYVAAHPGKPLRALHDPACMFPANADFSTFDVNAWRAPEGCTGFEGMITAGSKDDPTDKFNGRPNGLGAGGGFKPGGPYVNFCNDALSGNYNFCGDAGDLIGLETDILGGSLQRVTQFLGNGSILQVPTEGRDLRYYFKQFSIAMAKYMLSPESNNPGPKGGGTVLSSAAIAAQPIDLDYFVFDSYGGGASRSEYIDFTHADETHDPTDLELKWLLLGSNWQSTHFLRRLDREERALFNMMASDKSQTSWAFIKDAAGKPLTDSKGFGRPNANVFLSNMFGSPALAAIGFGAASDKNGNPIPVCPAADAACNAAAYDPCDLSLKGQAVVKSAHWCATHNDPDCVAADGSGFRAPTDDQGNLLTRENGKPLLDGYCGVFAGSTPIALDGPTQLSGLKVLEKFPNIQAAKVEFPSYEKPYDTTSAKGTPFVALVPWKPKQEGVGFPVAATGTRDVFVTTAQLDFTGQVITPIIDYAPVAVAATATTPAYEGVRILAVETEDFLGDVFLCYDPVTAANRAGTGRPGDILGVHMYTSVATILDWIAAHPQAQENCGLIVRYSPFNNYPDFIQSSTYGVRVNIEQGAGFGRVSDVTIFSPGVGQPANP